MGIRGALLAIALLLAPLAARAQTATLVFSDAMSEYGTFPSCGNGIGAPWLAQIDGSGTICNFYSSVVGYGGNGTIAARPLGASYSWLRATIGLTINDNNGGVVGINLYNSSHGNVGTGGSTNIYSNGGPYISCNTDGAAGSGLLSCSAGALIGVSGSFTATANVSNTFQMDVKIADDSTGTMTVSLNGSVVLSLTGITYAGYSTVDTVLVGADADGFANAATIGGIAVYALSSGGGGGGGSGTNGRLIDE